MIKKTFIAFYPWYALSIFVPGQWKENLLSAHGKRAEKVIVRFMKDRKYSEGILKENDMHLRGWFSPQLDKKGFPPQCIRVLSVKEIDRFLHTGNLPERKLIEKRLQSFFYMGDKIYPLLSLHAFLSQHNLIANLLNNGTFLVVL